MACEPMLQAADLRAVDNKIAQLNLKLQRAAKADIHAQEVAALQREVDIRLAEVRAHDAAHGQEWIEAGAPTDGALWDAWQQAKDITNAWQTRRDALTSLEDKCKPTRPRPRDPDGDATTPEEALVAKRLLEQTIGSS